MPSRFLLPFVVLLLLAQSCATNTSTFTNRSVSSAEVHEVVRANQARVQTATGEGTISIETPTMAQSGSFVLTLRKPDSLLVNLQGPFGIKVGSALLTRDSFQFYNSLENRLYIGQTTPNNLAKVLRVRIGFDDLLHLFMGGIFQEKDLRAPDQAGVEDNQFTYLYKTGDESHKYYIDPHTLLITKIQYLDGQGKLLYEQRFVNFQSIDNILVPFIIRILQPTERRMVSVAYSDLNLNETNLQFSFSYPQNAKRVYWQ
jgi:outer membrane lipoprotein-sorting protein